MPNFFTLPPSMTPRITAAFVQGSYHAPPQGSPTQTFLRPSAGNRGGMGKLPASVTEALTLINARRDPEAESLTEEDLYIHYLEAANNSFVSDRYCFIGESTLKNIATDAAIGFAYMNSHRTGDYWKTAELPLGATFCGRFERVASTDDDQTDDAQGATRRSVVGFYMRRGISPNGTASISTDDMHRSIDARTIFDCSVGLFGGRAVCDVCGNGVWEYDAENGRYLCPHYPGSDYQMTEEQVAAQIARGVPDGRCSYTIEDAHCNEVSAVYDGACPGAGFIKAALTAFSTGSTDKSEAIRDQESLTAKLSAGYGQQFTVSDLGKLREKLRQSGTIGRIDSQEGDSTPHGDATYLPKFRRFNPSSTLPDADPPGSSEVRTSVKEKKTMKLTKAELLKLFGFGANDPDDKALDVTNDPAPAPVNAELTAQLAALTSTVTTLTQGMTAQNETIKALGEELASSRKSAEDTAKAAAFSAAKVRIDAAKRAFKITPAAAKEMEALASEHPAAFDVAMKAFEKNGPVVTVAGIPGYSEENLAQDASEANLPEDYQEATERIEELAQKLMKERPQLKHHEAIQEVLRKNPNLGNAAESARRGGN